MIDLFKLSTRLPQLLKPAPRPAIAPTPSEVIYCENKLQVRHYFPKKKRRARALPVLIINSLINKYYILDLMPGKSYVEYLVNEGFDVYMLDWGVPDASDRLDTLADYIDKYIA